MICYVRAYATEEGLAFASVRALQCAVDFTLHLWKRVAF